ncbi:MAG: hypothetical protein IRZ16_01845 [Myxococcaceae bacterium]|nr:hypothetical protein [Myxococcaceae bacterium]
MTRVADLNSELNTVARATSVDGGIVVIGSPKLDAGVDWGWLVELRTQDGAEVGHAVVPQGIGEAPQVVDHAGVPHAFYVEREADGRLALMGMRPEFSN